MKNTHFFGLITFILLAGVGFWGYDKYTTYAPNEYVVETVAGTSTINKTTGETTRGVKKKSADRVRGSSLVVRSRIAVVLGHPRLGYARN